MSTKPIIALDADGVLLDYHHSYPKAWQKAFGTLPALRDPLAYWPMDRYEVQRLEGEELAKLRACFDEEFWSTIPAIEGAVEACHQLHDAGYRLVCVSAITPVFQQARLQNLQDCGFPIERVIATSGTVDGNSPKAAALHELRPVAFADDYAPFLRGIPDDVHAALILREPNGSPNVAPDLELAHSQHVDLADFARWWIDQRDRMKA